MAIFPTIYNKAELKKYIFRRLGSPVINIELTEDQLEDVINETIEKFVTVAYSGTSEKIIPVQFLSGVQKYLLPYNVFAVLSLNSSNFATGGASAIQNPFHINNYIASDLYMGSGRINLLMYQQTSEFLNTMNLIMGSRMTFDFNCWSKELTVFETIVGNMNVFLQIYEKIVIGEQLRTNPFYNPNDPQSSPEIMVETSNIYDQKWVKSMCVEKARHQWSVNMMKYSGSVLPNGGTLNVDGIMTMANENITKLEEELNSEYTLPPDFFIG